MLFREFVDSVQSIIAVADLVKNNSKDGTASMADFLYSLSNAGISMDYDKFKSVYDSEPELKNVIQQFDAENITFVGGKPDADAPVGDVPPEEKVGQMAKRAMNKREESILPEAYGSQHLAAVAKQFDELKDANEHGKAAQLLVQTFGNELEQKLIKQSMMLRLHVVLSKTKSKIYVITSQANITKCCRTNLQYNRVFHARSQANVNLPNQKNLK